MHPIAFVAMLGVALGACDAAAGAGERKAVRGAMQDTMQRPEPAELGGTTLAQALRTRRSVREFVARALSRAEILELAWAAQGITHGDGYRTAPSAGALYPLEMYLATADGLFHYSPRGHRLSARRATDVRPALERAAHGQAVVGAAPAVFIFAAVYRRTAAKYGAERAPRYVHLEVGHAAQNLLLAAAALGLGGVPVGAFDDAAVHRALGLGADEAPVYLVPVGEPAP